MKHQPHDPKRPTDLGLTYRPSEIGNPSLNIQGGGSTLGVIPPS